MHLKVAGCSDIGIKRQENQDHFLILPEISLFMVADGMGGHRGGRTASHLAVDVVTEYFQSKKKKEGEFKDPQADLKKAMQLANLAIRKKSSEDPEVKGMGTTGTLFLFQNQHAYFAHVGDSRAYFLQPHRIWQMTKDHSLVQEKLHAGMISRSQLKTDENKNVITRALGFDSELEIDLYSKEIHEDDVYLMCSDGLSGMVEDNRISAIVDQYIFEQNSLEKAIQALIDLANQNGGSDNVTTILIKVENI